MTDLSQYPMFADRALEFASRSGAVDPELARISAVDAREWDETAARKAYETVLAAADKGSPYAMSICVRFCERGWGRSLSNDEAFRWAKMAASAGFAPGSFELGACYERGIGVSKDLDEARKHYEDAAEGGFGYAAHHLALLHHSGAFGARDAPRAIQYALRAYDLGEIMSAAEIARWYEDGDGVVKNETEAVKWYEIASSHGDFFASNRLSLAYALGELGLPKDPDLARKYVALGAMQVP